MERQTDKGEHKIESLIFRLVTPCVSAQREARYRGVIFLIVLLMISTLKEVWGVLNTALNRRRKNEKAKENLLSLKVMTFKSWDWYLSSSNTKRTRCIILFTRT